MLLGMKRMRISKTFIKNMPVNVISDAPGHDSIATTQIYLATIDASTIDKANELIVKDL